MFPQKRLKQTMMNKRRNHSPDFKAKAALAAAKDNKTTAELVSQYGIHASQIKTRYRGYRKHKLDKTIKLTLKRQCELLDMSGSSAYYRPVGVSLEDLAIMHCMDELYMKYPFMGSRRLALELTDEGNHLNRKKV